MENIRVIGWTDIDDEEFPEIPYLTQEGYDAIVTCIRENGYKFYGNHHQTPGLGCTPVLNTGHKVTFSMRAWGAVMAEAHHVDNWNGMAYMKFYMDYFDSDTVYPPHGVARELIVPEDLPEPEPLTEDEEDALHKQIRRHALLSLYTLDIMQCPSHKAHGLVTAFDNNAALLSYALLRNAEDLVPPACAVNLTVSILRRLVTKDGRAMRDERLAHMEEHFKEDCDASTDLERFCPPHELEAFRKLDGDLFPGLLFLLSRTRSDKYLQYAAANYLEKLFRYTYLQDIDLNAGVDPFLITDGKRLLKHPIIHRR